MPAMHDFARPAIWLMSRLTFPRKLALVAALFLVPLLILAALLVARIDAQIAISERQLVGLEAIAPIKRLTAQVQIHRGASQLLLSGAGDARSEMAKSETAADIEAGVLDGHDQRHGQTLGTAAQWARVRVHWHELRKAAPTLSAEAAFRRHTDLIDALNAFLYETADSSRLTLTTETAPYYVAQLTTTHLPDLIENLGRIRALSSRIAQRKAMGAEERFQLAALIGTSQRAERNLLAQAKKVFEAVPELEERLRLPLREASSTIHSFTRELRERVLLPSQVEADGRPLFELGSLAIDATYRLDSFILPSLEYQVAERTRRLGAERRMILALIVAIMAAAGYLFLGFTVALLRNLATLKEAAARISGGDFDAQAQIASRDELASIGGSFNGMAASLRGLVGKLRDSEEKYRRIMEQAGDMILLSDMKGRLLDANRAAELALGYSRDELLAMSLFAIVRGNGGDARCNRVCLIGQSRACDEEHTALRKDGHAIPIHAKCTLIEYDWGQVMLSVFRDISALKESQRRIEHLATHDVLTGLANRALFDDRIEFALARAARQPEAFALLFLDLDNFKTVNDRLGHDRGDRLLKEVARRIEGCVRAGDTAARLGGDEFTLLIAGADREVAAATARRILAALAAPLVPGQDEITITASIGISLYPADGSDRYTLMKRADAAMYQAKDAGKNAFCFGAEPCPPAVAAAS